MKQPSKTVFEDVGKVWGLNGPVFAYLTLADVKDLVAIVLGLASIASTLVIIRNNLRRGANEPPK